MKTFFISKLNVMAKNKEKKAGKRMKKKELVKVVLEFFHAKQNEVLSLKYILNSCTLLHIL